jgi:hypothetical protein
VEVDAILVLTSAAGSAAQTGWREAFDDTKGS